MEVTNTLQKVNLMDGEGKPDKSVNDKMDWLALEEN